ncbi:MAG TPA: universal stress protein [Burkholderiaceae bacterium]|nr:universal stress protein [Burkholderiaceae bacterium]
MFKSILIPNDGSELSERATQQGLKLARSLGAKVVALHVTTPFHVLAVEPVAVTATREQYERETASFAKKVLEGVAAAARQAGVECIGVSRTGEQVWREVIQAAEANGCDAICMASHGRRGVAAVMLGSETVKVLTHSKIPVVVVR